MGHSFNGSILLTICVDIRCVPHKSPPRIRIYSTLFVPVQNLKYGGLLCEIPPIRIPSTDVEGCSDVSSISGQYISEKTALGHRLFSLLHPQGKSLLCETRMITFIQQRHTTVTIAGVNVSKLHHYGMTKP